MLKSSSTCRCGYVGNQTTTHKPLAYTHTLSTLGKTYALDSTNSRDGNILVPDLSLGKVDNVLAGDGAKDALNLGGVHAAAGGDDLAANVLGDRSGSVEGEEEGGLELGLGALDFGFGDGGGETGPFAEGKVDEVVNLGELVGDEVDSPETRVLLVVYQKQKTTGLGLPGVRVGGAEGHEAVGELVLVDERRESASEEWGITHGTVPVSNDGLGNESGKVVWVLPGDTLDGNGNVGSTKGIITHADLRANKLWASTPWSTNGDWVFRWGEVAKVLFGELNELLVWDSSGTDENHTVSLVVLGDVVGEVILLDGENVFLWTKDGASKGLSLESGGVKVIENNLLELLVNLLLLTENDISFPLNGGLLQL